MMRIRHEPIKRFGKDIDINKSIKEFYDEVKKYKIEDIICIVYQYRMLNQYTGFLRMYSGYIFETLSNPPNLGRGAKRYCLAAPGIHK